MLRAYYNLTKPGIIYGNLLTVVGGFLFGAAGDIDFVAFLAVVVGTALVIGSACVVNNYTDQEIDKKMQRTKKRELVTKKITPENALVFAFFLGLLGFITLGLFTNIYVVACGMIAYISYVVVYAYAKRKSYFGTLIGTIPGSMSLVAGYLAATNRLDVEALILFLIMATWQMAHFYAIALFRGEDYKRAKIPVFPLVKGEEATKRQITTWILLYLLSVVALTVFGGASYIFLIVMTLVTFWWFRITQNPTKDTAEWGRAVFGRSLIVLLTLSAMLSIDSFLM